jgi:hypothetical protein
MKKTWDVFIIYGCAIDSLSVRSSPSSLFSFINDLEL